MNIGYRGKLGSRKEELGIRNEELGSRNEELGMKENSAIHRSSFIIPHSLHGEAR